MQYFDYWLHKVLLFYIPPILLIIGTIGNVLSCCVLVRQAMRRTSTYNYLAVMAFTDMLVLYVGLMRLWIGELTGMDIKDDAEWCCKFISVAGYTVSVYSVWLLIAVTVERYIVTVHSLHASTMCTRSRAVKVILLILGLLLTINAHFLWTTELKRLNIGGDNITTCTSGNQFEYLVDQIWPWVDAFLYCFSPFVIICILNGLIIQQVIRSRRRRAQLSMNSANRLSNGKSRVSNESSVRVTIMLLTISFTFLICTLPMNVVMIYGAFLSEHSSYEQLTKYKLARTISELLMYTNHSINFYLYLLTGNKFRQQLMVMLCPCRKQSWSSNQTYSVVSQSKHRKSQLLQRSEMDTEMTDLQNGNYRKIGHNETVLVD